MHLMTMKTIYVAHVGEAFTWRGVCTSMCTRLWFPFVSRNSPQWRDSQNLVPAKSTHLHLIPGNFSDPLELSRLHLIQVSDVSSSSWLSQLRPPCLWVDMITVLAFSHCSYALRKYAIGLLSCEIIQPMEIWNGILIVIVYIMLYYIHQRSQSLLLTPPESL